MSTSPALPETLPPLLADALRKKGYDTLTTVQAAMTDPALSGRDLLVSSRTGSGKTVAYGLGMAGELLSAQQEGGAALPPAGKPLALVIAPTRELALQVQRELRWLYEATGAIIVSCVGGMDQRAERKHLERGVHIVVGTPGRLVDHLSRKALQLDQLAAVVLDEADEMLDLGFREDLELILGATPETRRTLLFSATLPKAIEALAKRFQRNAARIEVATDVSGHVDIEHRAAMVRPNGIEKGVVNLLRQTDSPASLVFCNTRDAVRRLHATLIERGFTAVILSGELGQHERNQAMQALRDGRASVCIATDVAARGIDLPNLGLVIHADLPHDTEVFQHRSGRTGRAGRKGISIMLVPPSRRSKAFRLFGEAGIQPQWMPLPNAEDIRALDRTRMLADDTPFAELTDMDRELGAALLETRPVEEIAAALARQFRARFPEPEEIDPLPFEEPRVTRKDRRDLPLDGPVQYSWFELGVGRKDGAEPKRLLRMLTKGGGLERRHIGGIRILDQVCHVEIATEVAERFERRNANPAEDEITVRRIDEPAAKPKRRFGDKPERNGPARGEAAGNPFPPAERKAKWAKDSPRKPARDDSGARPERPSRGKNERGNDQRGNDERVRTRPAKPWDAAPGPSRGKDGPKEKPAAKARDAHKDGPKDWSKDKPRGKPPKKHRRNG